MSENKTVIFECEKCGCGNEAQLWPSVNAGENPELRAAILNGTLFMHKCAECGTLAGLKYPCLYHDSERRFMVYLIPDVDRNHDFTRLPMPAEILMSDIDMEGYRLRVAQNLSALVDKIHTFENGLDDRAAETCKLLALGKLQERRADYIPAATHFERRENNDLAGFINEKGETANVILESGLYDEVLKSVHKLENDEPRFQIIDLEWAKDFAERAQRRPQG